MRRRIEDKDWPGNWTEKGLGLMRATACLLPLLTVGTGIHAVWTRSYQCSPDKCEWTSGGPTHMNNDEVGGRGYWIRVLKVVKVGSWWLKELEEDVDVVDLSSCW